MIAFFVLLAFLFGGKYVMQGLNLTTSALSIAGAIVLFLISLRLIFPDEKKEANVADIEEPFIVPLAIPLIAGPSAMAIVMLWVARMPEHQPLMILAITIASAVCLAFMLLAHSLMRILGKSVLIAIERLTGMILITIAVQMFLSGLVSYLH